MKLCKKCNTSKHSYEFYSNPRSLSGLSSICCECCKASNEKWKKNNPKKILEYRKNRDIKRQALRVERYKQSPELKRKIAKEYRRKNHQKVKCWVKKACEKQEMMRLIKLRSAFLSGDYGRPYANIYCGGPSDKQRKGNIKTQLVWAQSFRLQKQKKTPVYDPVKQKAYSLANRERDRAKRNKRKSKYRENANDSKRLSRRMSGAISRSLCGTKAGRHWETLVGYTLNDLKKHLESLWAPGMNWKNRGINGWHIDHVFPESRLVIDGPDDPTFRFCWSLDNLQPLWSDDNIQKADSVA